jgi:hypothetical protein
MGQDRQPGDQPSYGQMILTGKPGGKIAFPTNGGCPCGTDWSWTLTITCTKVNAR